MKTSIVLNILLYLMVPTIAFANQECPDLNGRYIVKEFSPVIGDAGKLFKMNIVKNTNGEIEIKGNSNQELSFLWKSEKSSTKVLSSSWKIDKDYKCNKGWVSFFLKTPSYRNDLPGLYEGFSTIRLSKDDLYGGLKVESYFTGYENISLFSYDSAHISVNKWWGKKKLRESVVLDTVPVEQKKSEKEIANRKSESKEVLEIRRILTDQNLKELMLVGVEENNPKLVVTLRALHLSEMKEFQSRLQLAGIDYQIKTEPVWTNNSYFLELLVNMK
jgi:hypothetical protein